MTNGQAIQPNGALHPRVYILTEFPSPEELLRGVPFCGSVGGAFDRMLGEVGLLRSYCYFSYVTCKGLPPQNKGKIDHYYPKAKKDQVYGFHQFLHDRWVHPDIAEGAERVKREIELLRPEVIVLLGNASLHTLLGQWGIQSWRGSLAYYEGIPVIATYTPQYLFRMWNQRPVVVADLQKVKRVLEVGTPKEPDWDFIIRPSFQVAESTLAGLLEALDQQRVPYPLAVDIETRGGHINCIGFAWDKVSAITVPLISVERPGGFYSLEEEGRLVWLMYKIMTHPMCRVVGQNFSYDTQYIFRAWHFWVSRVDDTMVMQHTLYPSMEKGLGFLSSLHAEDHVYWKEEGYLWDPSKPEEEHWKYNAKDCCRTWEVYHSLKETLEKEKMWDIYEHRMTHHWPAILRAMFRGVRIDEQRRKQLQLDLFKKINEAQARVNKLVGHELNVGSSPQMQKLFYEDLGQPKVFAKKPNAQGIKPPSVDSDALDKIMDREPGLGLLCVAIQELRSLQVFYRTFALAKLDYDRRMRSDFKIAGTDTLRLSSSQNAFGSGMNLQNIPKGDE